MRSASSRPWTSTAGATSRQSRRGSATPSGPLGGGDLWVGKAPTIEEIDERLGGDHEARHLLFEWSMVDCVENYFQDERLQMAYLGQGVIGTNASPHDRGTASIHFHHQSGRLGGSPGMWGYVKGGMGMVSFILCDIARDLGAVVLTGTPVARIIPGEGVELEGGERIAARHVISNADPRATLKMLGGQADPAWKVRVEQIPQVGCTVKLNVVLKELAQLLRPARHRAWTTTGARSTLRSPRTSGRRRSKRPARASSSLASGRSSTSTPPTTRLSRPRASTR